MKGLVLHDYFERADGGGRLCLLLARGLGLDLACGFLARENPYFSAGEVPLPRELLRRVNIPLLRQFLLARAFEQRTGFVPGYETAVYSGAYAPLAVRTHPAKRTILYCHTPPRFLYDQRPTFLAALPAWQRPLLAAFLSWLTPRYEDAVARMDTVVANSATVQARIKNYLHRESVVVHPPCETARFTWEEHEGYYLSSARLDPLKRVDAVVKVFRELPKHRLVVASDGPERWRLEALAAGAANITFVGGVDEATYTRLVNRSIATIYVARDEDFGMTPVESMAAGKPVIGVAEGGLTETVRDGETGLLLETGGETPLAAAIAQAVVALTPDRARAMRGACEARAGEFDVAVFLKRMRGLLG